MTLSRNQIIGIASSVFLIPSFVLTVAPTFVRDPGVAICMALSVIALPLVPFAIRRAKSAGELFILLVLGSLTLLYNFQNALDALNGSHAIATSVVRDRIATAKSLNEKISDLSVRKGQVGSHRIVSDNAAASAQRARDDECRSGQGPVCRSLTAALVTINQDRASTKLDEDLDKAKTDLAALGAIETTSDRTASQLASLAGLVWSPAANSGETISNNRPIFKASIVELMGGLMPWVMVTIFGAAPKEQDEVLAKATIARRAKDAKRKKQRRVADKKNLSADTSADARAAKNRKEVRDSGDNVVSLPSLPAKRKRKRKLIQK